jgi:serine/threonine-protein kinase
MSDISDRLTAALADRYTIERELGEGGMATVFLAQDLKHQRKVAIKLLKPELAAVLGAERFVQEITTTAALQHPHILPLFDSGTADGFLYYVMPFIDGETLRDKLNRETQLGIEEAVRIAREVSDALDYAHRHGVIHRDIKPENILLHDGRPMVADFGIALAVSAAAGGRMTETGLSLGTPHYMSPEQATAEKEIDARSDVYSVGSVLYEMLTGNPPHVGSSAQQIIMRIVTEEAEPVTKVRRAVPTNVAAAVAKSLEKLPADRFESAKAFADALADQNFTTASIAPAGRGQGPVAARSLVYGLGAALAAVTLVAGWALTRPEPTKAVVRYGLALPPDQRPDPAGFVMISPDGSRIVYQGFAPGGLTQLWVKDRDALHATPLSGSDAVTSAALSPDGAYVAMVQGGLLRKMPLSGGAAIQLADQVGGASRSLAWLDDGTIAFVQQASSQIMRVPAAGGTPESVWSSDSLTVSNLSPLPGGRGVLFQACARPCDNSDLMGLDLSTGQAHIVVPGGRAGHYLPTGDLLYVRDDLTGVVVPFDLDGLEPRGEGFAVLDSVSPSVGTSPYLAVSQTGTLVMRTGTNAAARESELVIVDRSGGITQVDSTFTFRNTQFAGNFGWSVSPDGRKVAISISTASGDDIWVKPLDGSPAAKVTFSRGADTRPRWTPDGRWISFISDNGIGLHRSDGTGQDSLLLAGSFDEALISRDNQWLLFRQGAKSAAAGFRDIFGIRMGIDTAPQDIVVTDYDEMAIALSPDGEWLAYQSDEAGRLEVFIRPFPNTDDAKIPVSSGGGTGPLWSRDMREFYYLDAEKNIVAVTLERTAPGGTSDQGTLRLGARRPLFRLEGGLAQLDARFYTPWDITPDGRFVLVRALGESASEAAGGASLVVIENWIAELKAKLRR